MTAERLPDMLARLEQERDEADRRYNEALTALDRSLAGTPPLPTPPPPYDEQKLADVNASWNILPDGPPAIDRSLKGRLRGLMWRLVGPPLETQRHFNAALVDHLNRNAAAHRDTQAALGSLTAALAGHAGDLIRVQAHLIQYLQTITLYVDTKDRAVAGQIQVINAGLDAIAGDWLKRWESSAAPANRIAASVATLEEMRDGVALAQQTSLTLKREVEKLIRQGHAEPAVTPHSDAVSESAQWSAPGSDIDVNAYKYLGFEDAFRGSREEIRARMADYVGLFAGRSTVLDVGCGRGEFLDLLREAGIDARGIDVNHEMVEASRARGLAVEKADAVEYLERQADDSLGGVFSAQVIEHLQPEYLLRLLDLAAYKIRPGGVIVLETINPACWAAFFDSYIRDLTHVRPIHPETLQYLLRASGFPSVSLDYRSPVDATSRLRSMLRPAGDLDPVQEDVIETFNANVETLNGRLFTFRDYAAIGRK